MMPGKDLAVSGGGEGELEKYLSNTELYTYSIHPFYGYNDWTRDVIDYFGDMALQNLSDDELYGTGRAWSQASSDLLWSHGNFSGRKPLFEEHPRKALRRFRKYAASAIGCYKTLYQRHPGYQTLVGSIEVKYDNEIMSKWYELMIFGFKRKADRMLAHFSGNQSLYKGFWNSFAETMLSIPDSGAVLFTNGDNDTYPLLYAQHSGNVRNDIRIINISLLNDPVYYRAVVNGLTGAAPFTPGVSANLYSQIARMGIYIDPEYETSPSPFSAWRNQAIEQLKNRQSTISLSRTKYQYVFKDERELPDTINAGTNLPNYIIPGIFILPSLVMDLYPRHPVYFSKGCIQSVAGLFSPGNLVDQALVIRLNGLHKTLHDSRYVKNGNIYTDTLTARQFFSRPRMDLPGGHYPAQQRTYSWLLDDVSFLVGIIATQSEEGPVIKLAEQYLSRYPLEQCGVNHDHCNVLNILLAAGKDQRSVKTNEYVMEMLAAIRKAVESLEITDSDVYDEFNARYLSWCISLLTNTMHYGPQDFYDELDRLKEELENKMVVHVSITTR